MFTWQKSSCWLDILIDIISNFSEFYQQSNSASCFACLAGFLIFILLCLKAAMHIYGRASAKGKRVQSNMGAKNHAIVLSDASEDAALNAIVAAGFGAAGQRCMALSTVVFVGGAKSWDK
ncbi:methylmalonate-semialdehyde dehydrogenase [acylating], mitochondrial-like isoform X2 [Ziziphus jujuba]|uniref:methylmalonate-semialdehyde dehydrogenase (CoA acylating) n=1 Tax=Ziziphus jujuba TaxID=326968 RepID=A0ABM4AIC2_ZIZJJ|nr:methylmalonate-semialdehyde dehydrogenase [acylating], mitochondrial-like isoform X2 [Ziziphus jujuba]